MLEVPKVDAIVKETFCRLYDSIEITPLFGRKRKIVLNRTLYHIDLTGDEMAIEGNNIILPLLHGQELRASKYRIDLIDYSIGQCFCLRSLSGELFKINGTYSSYAVLKKGDVFQLGHNRIEVSKQISSDVEESKELEIHPELNVLIEGETGTGKTFLAKKIHDSANPLGRFVHLNLSAYSKGVLESELFGHVKGAFTGAICDKQGALKTAENGTLFLDEIDSISKDLQAKLLLFLDSGLFYPVGSNTAQVIKTRVIVASGRALKNLVEKDEMRRDFYYRISSEEVITLDPLRRDIEKIDSLLNSYESRFGVTIHPKLKSFYRDYEWPGNIRQLQAHLKKKKLKTRANLISYCEMDESLLELKGLVDNGLNCDDVLSYRELKWRYFKKIYERCDQNVSAAAKILGVSNQTVRSVLSI